MTESVAPRWSWIDGTFVLEHLATIPVLDRGLLLGDGVFETVRLRDGHIEYFAEHHARLCASAQAVRIPQPWSVEQLTAVCRELCERSQLRDASVRLTLTRGAYRGTLSATNDPPRLIITCASAEHMDPALYTQGVKVALASHPRVHALDPSIKALMYLPAVLARLEADEQGCYETLFADPRGRLLELSTASFLAVRDGQILTPPLRLGLLPGITRAAVLRLAKQNRIRAREAVLRTTDLPQFDEAFLTSAVRGVIPIVQLAGRTLGDGTPGPITRRIQELFAQETGRKVP